MSFFFRHPQIWHGIAGIDLLRILDPQNKIFLRIGKPPGNVRTLIKTV